MRFIFLITLFFCIFSGHTEEKSLRAKFENGSWSYQAGLFKFERDDIEVTFVSAIHIGPKVYYDKLNKYFKRFDAVLYESVKGYQQALKENGIEKAPWDILAERLNLRSQLKSIDYKAGNFVHADMSLGDLLKMDGIQKEDVFNPLKVKEICESFEKAPIGILMGFYRKNFSREELKNPIIINSRNSRCLEILEEELKENKKVAIFYGAAHFKDMKMRLEKQGFKLVKTSWATVYRESK